MAGVESVEQSQQPVLGQVFNPLESFGPDVRLDLAELVRVPGQASVVLPGQLSGCALPADHDRRDAVRQTLTSGLDATVLAGLMDRRLDEVVPVLAGRDDDPVLALVSSKVRGRVERLRAGRSLPDMSVGEIAGWPGIGPRRAVLVVAAAVDAGFESLGADEGAVPGEAGPTVDDLVAVLVHDATVGGAVRRQLEHLASDAAPGVRSAVERLLAVPTAEASRCLVFLDEALRAAGDERDRSVFEHVALPLGPPVSRGDLASALGIGSERVRQLAARAAARVDGALDAAPPEVRRLTSTLAERIGSAAPLVAVEERLAALGLPEVSDTRSRLLLQMAGPYRPVGDRRGWVATEPAELVTETARMIHEDGGVRLGDQLAKELRSLGVRDEHVAAWLAGQPLRTVDGLAVATTGTPGDVAERVLHACGRALAIDELAAWFPDDDDAVEALWTARDRRFHVTADDGLALTEWGDDDDLTAGPAQRTGTLRVTVDPQVLTGAEAPVPSALVHALGMGRGSRRTFTTRFGPVTLAHDADQPTRGSIRPVALAVGAAPGDELVFTLYAESGEAAVELVASPDPSRATMSTHAGANR